MTAEFYVDDSECLRAHGLTPGSAADGLAKWEKLYALAISGELVRDGGFSTCAFCEAYHHEAKCEGCPISKVTGQGCCFGTAYDNYVDAVADDDVEAAIEAAGNMVNLLAGIWRNEQ